MGHRFAKLLSLLSFLTVATPVSAAWEDQVDWTWPSSKNPKVQSLGLYAVEVRCSPRGGSLEGVTNAWTGKTRSLLLLITKSVGTGTPAVDKLPSDAVGAVQAYSASSKDWTSYDYRHCKKDFLVAGSKLALVAVKNENDDPAGGPLGQFVSGLLGIVSPLFSFFTGQALPTEIASKITNLQSAADPFSKLLGALKSGSTQTRPVDVLRTGTYSYVTDYAAVSVTIRSIESIVLDRNPSFRDDLRAQVKAAPDKIDATKLKQSCLAARAGISDLGFRSTIDIAYGMIALAGKAGINKGQMLDCLSYPYAMAIAGRRDQNSLIWKDFLAEQKFGQDDIDRYLLPVDPSSTQPKFRVIASKVDDLVISLAQYARNNPHPQQAVDHLTTLLAEDIAVVDKTSDLVVGGNGSYKRFDLIKKLTAENTQPPPERRYIRFGCYEEAKDTTGLFIDGASSIFLVFKAKNDDTTVSFENVLAMKPGPDSKNITGLIVSSDRSWINKVLTNWNYVCGDFSIKRPT
ncbi:hypothetical protein AAFX91_38285 [Bradyrhizobium sp. 31Argb]|uniref:hypothetical protein n=1 Tax=Bradyrhizobium sp. 31Argb TaxID=3141247 RepID=UPI003747D792